MEVRNCRQCGALYNYIGGPYRHLCPSCIRDLEDKFSQVKEYIDEHHEATMAQISEDCDVNTKQIEQWVREERLFFSSDSPIGIPCQNCGATIKSGKYCASCKATMTNDLNSMYGTSTPAVDVRRNDRREKARMRFLDK